MKVHLDFGYFCWQLVSVVQRNDDHEEFDGSMEVVEATADTQRIGFGPNDDEED